MTGILECREKKTKETSNIYYVSTITQLNCRRFVFCRLFASGAVHIRCLFDLRGQVNSVCCHAPSLPTIGKRPLSVFMLCGAWSWGGRSF